MPLTAKVINDEYSYTVPVCEMTAKVKQTSEAAFVALAERGNIKATSYLAPKWTMTDEVHKGITINFAINKTFYNTDTRLVLACSYEQFVLAFRILITSNFGKSLHVLQALATAVRNFVVNINNLAAFIKKLDSSELQGIIDLLNILPGRYETRDRLIDYLENCLDEYDNEQFVKKQRMLGYYQSYYRFGNLLDQFWCDATLSQRLLFFPIYLWWHVTMIIPLRPTEFVLTPRNCIELRGEKYYIKLRRTKLKGSRGKSFYTLADDYIIENYPIPADLAKTVLWYCDETKDAYASDIHTLFCKTTQFSNAGVLRPSNNHYTRENLDQCLKRFYAQIIEGKYHYQVVTTELSELSECEIQQLLLGDTRHIALISLVLSGASLSACKELAGHNSIDMGSHYYSNVKSFLDAVNLSRVRWKPTVPETLELADGCSVTPIYGGKCLSPKVAIGCFEDCAATVDDYEYIGSCKKCRYYIPDLQNSSLRKKTAERALAHSYNLLRIAVEQVRRGNGQKEDILTELERFRTSGMDYLVQTNSMSEKELR